MMKPLKSWVISCCPPHELFSQMVKRGNAEGKENFILDDLSKVFSDIEQSTLGTDSEEDFQTCLKNWTSPAASWAKRQTTVTSSS
jgi:hypothetical protein